MGCWTARVRYSFEDEASPFLAGQAHLVFQPSDLAAVMAFVAVHRNGQCKRPKHQRECG